MSSRKAKVATVFQKLFRSSSVSRRRSVDDGAPGRGTGGSPARRLLRAAYAVAPVDSGPTQQHQNREVAEPKEPSTKSRVVSIFKKNKTNNQNVPGPDPATQKCVRNKRLMKELKDIQASQHNKKNPSFTVELINDNLYEWHVRLYSIDSESDLASDMKELGITYISLQMSFPENFPFVPPFMRVVTPRIEKGFVMEGGAICMELLTPRGWASAYTIEAVIMQFAASLAKGRGRISRKTKPNCKDFNKRVAEESFRSLVKTHDKYGWVTPPLADG